MSLPPRIVVIGSANTDMVIKTERIPHPGETVIGGEFIMAAGGKGANQAVAAARLGAQVTFIARLGVDVFGDQAVAGYDREGIDTSYIVRDDAVPSGIAMIFVDIRGENSIAVASGANAHLDIQDVDRARDAIVQADVVLVQLEIPLPAVRHALKVARKANVLTILNPAPGQKLDPDLLAMVSILTPNEHEVQMVAGILDRDAAVKNLLNVGIDAVLVTLGSAGVFWSSSQNAKVVPSFGVHAVDTTAAGDAFNGGLACALGQGLSMEEAIRYANAVAAISVTRMGAQPSLPSKDEVSAFLVERFG
jgi:ribokinase